MAAARKKPPFGIGQVGKSFRNEITPGNFIFRTREFEQMELEFFCEPGTDEEWHQYWIDYRKAWYTDLGISEDNLRLYEHPAEKLSHYSKRTVDLEYRFGFAGSEWGELEGIANRTDFDLSTHAEHSGKDMSYFDQTRSERWTPYVIEPSAGLTRSLMAFLVEAYTEDEAPNTKGGVDKRIVLRLDPRIAPVKAAVLPLSRKEELTGPAKELAARLADMPQILRFPADILALMNENYLGGPVRDAPPCAFVGDGNGTAADLTGYPPAYIENCENDDLRASGEAFARQLAGAGADVELWPPCS